MKVFNGLIEVNIRDCVVTMGTFDGLHCGHKLVIDKLLQKSKKLKKPSMVITFDPHPRLVLQKNIEGLKMLTTKEEKITLFNNMNIDYLLFLPFTYEFSQQTAEEFIDNYLTLGLGISSMVIGYDHKFGNQDGQEPDVESLLLERGIDVARIPEHDIENIAVSSTKVRKALNDGDVKLAKLLLGYPYNISGIIVHGQKVGRVIGFPTANLMLRNHLKLLPADGVYAVEIKYRMRWLQGMMNIGLRPTFGINERTIEIHIFDFNNTIYGESISIRFVDRVRGEMAFDSADNLKNQLILDKILVQKIFEDLS
jgi:riboflavin kinase / FMN adenylyltransferase